ncbi:MAG: nuclear transport factor 2 family protein [Gemmatimonadota bacterium]
MFATAAGALWGLALLAVTLGVGVLAARAVRPGRRFVWTLLGVGLASVPLLPAPFVPIRVERVHYAGPDLLSDTPETTAVVSEDYRVAGLSRVQRTRRVQGSTLLSETRWVGLRLPWLLLAGLLVSIVSVRRGSRGRTRLVLVLLLAGGAAGCRQESRPGAAELRLQEVLEMRRTGDVTGVEDVFLAGAVYQDMASGFEYRGLPEIADHLGWIHGWATGVFMDVVEVHGGRETASAEWVLEGIQSSPIPGQLDTVTRRRFQLRGITVVEVERGAVSRAVDYLDMVPFLLDLGAEIRLPGGAVIRLPEPEVEPPGNGEGDPDPGS